MQKSDKSTKNCLSLQLKNTLFLEVKCKYRGYLAAHATIKSLAALLLAHIRHRAVKNMKSGFVICHKNYVQFM